MMKKEMVGIPVMYWGGELEDLEEMRVRGTYYETDYVFNVTYIDAYVDLYTLFKKNANKLLVNDKEEDKDILENINSICTSLNDEISNLSGIKAFEEKIEPKYKKYRHDNISISVKSEIAVKGLYSNIVPYIKQDDDESLYPTSGEGRKKLLVYSIFDLLSQDVRLLRLLKDELYLFTLSNEPTGNIKVAAIDDDRVANDELVISIGTTETISLIGLKGISADQWYRNIVMHDLKYDIKDLLDYAPTLAKQVSGKLSINSLYEDKYQRI